MFNHSQPWSLSITTVVNHVSTIVKCSQQWQPKWTMVNNSQLCSTMCNPSSTMVNHGWLWSTMFNNLSMSHNRLNKWHQLVNEREPSVNQWKCQVVKTKGNQMSIKQNNQYYYYFGCMPLCHPVTSTTTLLKVVDIRWLMTLIKKWWTICHRLVYIN